MTIIGILSDVCKCQEEVLVSNLCCVTLTCSLRIELDTKLLTFYVLGQSAYNLAGKLSFGDTFFSTEWPKKMFTLFTHQYLWNKFK